MSGVLEVLAQARAPAAGSLDRERELFGAGQCLSPVLQLAVSSSAGDEDKLGEYLPEVVERDGVVALFVGVDPDCDHRVLLIVWRGTWVMWRPPDRAVLSDVQASMKSRRRPWTTAGDRSLRGH